MSEPRPGRRPERIVDFHAHWLPPQLAGGRAPADFAEHLRGMWPLLTDIGSQVEAAECDEIDVRLLSTPLEMLAPVDQRVPVDLVQQVNELLATAAAEHGPRISGLASIDVFAGDAGAEQARYAIDELGFPGLFVAARSGELLLDAPQARATLELAAERGVPVLAHPVNPPVLADRYAGVAGAGHALGRASESAISTLALLRSGLLGRLPRLRVVIVQLSSVSLLLAHYLDLPGAGWDGAPPDWKPSDDRARLYVDTAGFEPIAINAALDAVGPAHLLMGTDWPVDVNASASRIAEALRAGGVAEQDLDRVAAGNALALLDGRDPAPLADAEQALR